MKNYKKLVSAVTAIAISFGAFAGLSSETYNIGLGSSVVSAEATNTYKCGDNLTATLIEDIKSGLETHLIIKGTGDMYDYSIDNPAPWYDYDIRTEITSVYISNGVTSIGSNAFYDFRSLRDLSFPDTVTEIGKDAFSSCTNLENVSIPDIDSWYNMKFENYGSNPCRCGVDLYVGNKLLREVVIPDSMTEIKDYMFAGVESLETVFIPDTVTSIGNSAFSDCSGLISARISENLTTIGSNAFNDCSNLENIKIPKNVTNIGINAFAHCKNLKNVYIEDMVSWCSIGFENETSNPCSNSSSLYLNDEKVTVLEIPENITVLKDYAFYGCTGITNLYIPKGVTSVGNRAFMNCIDLEAVTVYDGVKSIGDEAFSDCKSLVTAAISEGVQSIGKQAFCCCKKLVDVNIPKSVTEICNMTFYDCDSIKNIIIPENVTKIGDMAFFRCENLENIRIENPLCEINDTDNTISNDCGHYNDKFYGVIYGYDNSTAQSYAEKYGYAFESLGKSDIVTTATTTVITTQTSVSGTTVSTSVTETNKNLKGDADGDNVVNVRDCALIAQLLAGGRAEYLPETADFNGDGKINVRDAAAIAMAIAKKIT